MYELYVDSLNESDLIITDDEKQDIEIIRETLQNSQAQKTYVDFFSNYVVDKEIFEKSEMPYNGKIYILVDDKVYSSAENFVMFCKNTKFATLIGTTTKGDGGIADPLLFVLPNSGLLVRFSVFYGLNQDGSGNEANGTQPDIIILKNEDALKKRIELID